MYYIYTFINTYIYIYINNIKFIYIYIYIYNKTSRILGKVYIYLNITYIIFQMNV